MNNPNPIILSASGLAKTYGKGPTAVDVLKEIDLQVSASEKVAIVGSSGSGNGGFCGLVSGTGCFPRIGVFFVIVVVPKTAFDLPLLSSRLLSLNTSFCLSWFPDSYQMGEL